MPSVTIQIFVFTKMEKKATDVAHSTAFGEKLQPSSFVLSPQDLTGGPAVQPYPRSPKLNRKTGRSPPLTEVRGERKTEMREEMYVCVCGIIQVFHLDGIVLLNQSILYLLLSNF